MKYIICLVVMLSVFCARADAEASLIETGKITPVGDMASYDLDEDGTSDTIEYEIVRDSEGYDTGYILRVGNSQIMSDGYSMSEEINLLKLNEYTAPFLMISDYGPSDDYETQFYLYENGTLQFIGTIPSLPELMYTENGIITASVRGNVLYTWFREADYTLARSFGEDGQIPAALFEIPRPLYPMGIIVTLKVDLPLFVSPTNHDIDSVIDAGEQVVLCATDDKEWVYITSLETNTSGWLQINRHNSYECFVGKEVLGSYDVFDGLLFAD